MLVMSFVGIIIWNYYLYIKEVTYSCEDYTGHLKSTNNDGSHKNDTQEFYHDV